MHNLLSIKLRNAGVASLLVLLTLSPVTSLGQVKISKAIPDFSKQINGIFLLDGAECAGFEFRPNELLWRNESACMYPDTFFIYWTDPKSFIAKEKRPPTGKISRAPVIWFYTIDTFDGKKLTLRELWTGWGPFKNEMQTFRKVGM